MDVFQAISTRRSVRTFTDYSVSEEEVMKMIDAATCAPSAGNIQPWEFIVIREPKQKKALAMTCLNRTLIENAPLIVVVCANQTLSSQGYGSRGSNLYCLQDTAAATQNMMLAACALGLATCWVGAFQEEEAKKLLKIPDGVRPVAIIPVGQAAEKPAPTPRRPTEEIVHRECFR